MNMLDGEIMKNGSGYLVQGDGYQLPVPRHFDANLEAGETKEVTVGLRPEHFSATEEVESDKTVAAIDLIVDVAEYVGANQYLAARIGDKRVSVSVEAGPERGAMQSGTYYFDTDWLYLFDKKTGETLKPAQPMSAI